MEQGQRNGKTLRQTQRPFHTPGLLKGIKAQSGCMTEETLKAVSLSGEGLKTPQNPLCGAFQPISFLASNADLGRRFSR